MLSSIFLLQTVLSGEVYTGMCFLVDMVNVSLELKDPKGKESASSLARYGFKPVVLLLMTVDAKSTCSFICIESKSVAF